MERGCSRHGVGSRRVARRLRRRARLGRLEGVGEWWCLPSTVSVVLDEQGSGGWEGGGSSETIHYTRFAAQSEAFFQPLGVNPNLQIGYVCIFILALY